MKKFTAILLIILPLFLVFTISAVGIYYKITSQVLVERLYFVDDDGAEIDDIAFSFIIAPGDTKQLVCVVVPENATNDKLIFFSSDGKIVSVSATGLITGIAIGSATISARTEDERRSVSVLIIVLPSS